MKTILLTAAPEDENKRLDIFLSDKVINLTRSAAQRLIEDGHVLLRECPLKKNHRVGAEETILVEMPDPAPIEAAPQEIPLDIVYEDEDVAVIDKPRGMVVHPAPGNPDGTLVNAILAHCGKSLSGVGGAVRPGIVHRIDKDTSGLLIVAKNDRAHLRLSAQLKDHTLARVYEAVVLGNLKEDRGTVSAPIGRSPKNRKKMAVVADGRSAVTHYEVIARYPGFTHVRCRLETGRTHQIRVHMAYLGHPLAGDPLYGRKNDGSGLQGQCLHAKELTFIHPATGETMRLIAPLPAWFTVFLERLARHD
ncbi:MAG: RluA family pseudouridine synthase [Clostridia bacterium]|nr:RluA family pseudouridine synthase [Clostridia bacterium]